MREKKEKKKLLPRDNSDRKINEKCYLFIFSYIYLLCFIYYLLIT